MTTTATKQFIKSPAVGMGRVQWLCADGEQVEAGQAVARFIVGNNAHAVTATATGRLTITAKVADSVTLQGGNPIAYIDPNTEGSKPLKRAISTPTESIQNYSIPSTAPRGGFPDAPHDAIAHTSPTTTTATPIETPYNAPQRATEGKARRGFDVPQPEPVLTVLESGAAVNPAKKQKGKKTKTAHTTYHITEQQAAALIDLSTNFRKDPDTPSYSASEIVRAAVEHLLNQDRPTVEAILSHNREREKRGKYGAGWRKPSQK